MKHKFAQMTGLTVTAQSKRHSFGLVGEFGLACAGGMILTLSVGGLISDGRGVAFALFPYVFGMALAAYGLRQSYPHDELGLCNYITAARLALVSGLTPLIWTTPGDAIVWFALGVAVLSLSLDGVDGWAARRSGLASAFGARFDMEVDSGFAFLLSIVAFGTGQAGPWVLALGVPHYLFVGAAAIWPWLAGNLPDLNGRKVVCVLQMGVLVGFLIPAIPQMPLVVGSGVVAVALLLSFLRDIRYLYDRRQA